MIVLIFVLEKLFQKVLFLLLEQKQKMMFAVLLTAALFAAGCSKKEKETEAPAQTETKAQTEVQTEAKAETEAQTEAKEAAAEDATEAAEAAVETMSEAEAAVETVSEDVMSEAEEAATEAEEAATEAEEAAAQAAYEEAKKARDDAQEELRKEFAASGGLDGFVGGDWMWPVPTNTYISSGYGYRNIFGYREFHTGIDIPAPEKTPIKATNSGVVTVASYQSTGYGNRIIVDHGGGYKSLYAHCHSLAVKVGDYVVQGDTIAYVGSTGLSTGNHLHFEIRVNDQYVDPTPYVR